MLEAFNLSRPLTAKGADPRSILETVSFAAPASQVTLVVGPPGSGKRSLLEALSGIRPADQGVIMLHGRDLSRQPLHPNELGVVTNSTRDCLPSQLSAKETLASAIMLRVRGLSPSEVTSQSARLLALCGLETLANERVSNLTPVHYRRLLLATALVSDPILVLCQDFTHNIDAKSERELVALLKLIAADLPGRIVINLTSSLAQLPAYDTAIVLHEGNVCFHGPARAIPHYFTIKSVEDLYPRLAMRPAARWGDSWARHRDSYYAAFKIGATPEELAAASDDENTDSHEPARIRLPSKSATQTPSDAPEGNSPPVNAITPPAPTPSFLSQTAWLVSRRWTLLRRSKRDSRILAALFFALPLITVLLIWPNKVFLTAALNGQSTPLPPETLWPAAYTCLMAAYIQNLVVIFFALRCGAREIAQERELIDRERLGGVPPGALLLSKVIFLFPLVLGQAIWLGLFVEIVAGGLPSPLWIRLALPALTGLAFTSLCLAISSFSASRERAHSRCLTLAFGQVLLAGALLGLPRIIGSLIHPFITAYYGWSGIVSSMAPSPLHDAIGTLVRTSFAESPLAISILVVHILVALIITRLGLRKISLP